MMDLEREQEQTEEEAVVQQHARQAEVGIRNKNNSLKIVSNTHIVISMMVDF